MITRLSFVAGNTEKLIASLEGDAADTAIDALVHGMTADAIAAKFASLEWDSHEGNGFANFVVYIPN